MTRNPVRCLELVEGLWYWDKIIMGNIWRKLRQEVLKNSEIALAERLKTNPVPTELECRIGAFVEELEEQVRDAVILMNEKGYCTASSGFAGADQVIDGEFKLDKEIVAKLKKAGAKVSGRVWSEIRFTPLEQDISKIKKIWAKIVSILPDKGHIAETSMTVGAEEFRKKYKGCHGA